MIKTDKPKKLYLVWEQENENESGYFLQFDTLREAIDAGVQPTEVYIASIRFLGKFKMVTKPVKIKRRKIKNANKTRK